MKMSTYFQLQNKIIMLVIALLTISIGQDSTGIGYLSIKLNSPGYIYINSTFLSNQSVENIALLQGEYKIDVFSSQSRKWNERGYEKQIKIQPGKNIILNIENTNLYFINSSPYGSLIMQNDKIVGRTPAYINEIDITPNDNLMLKKNGYSDRNIILNKDQSEYFFKLKPNNVNSALLVANPGLVNSQASWFKEGFVVVSLVSSWAAFYFKREADKNYSKYLREGNPVLMNQYFDKTNRFDTYSDISISISVASLGTYMYFLIFD